MNTPRLSRSLTKLTAFGMFLSFTPANAAGENEKELYVIDGSTDVTALETRSVTVTPVEREEKTVLQLEFLPSDKLSHVHFPAFDGQWDLSGFKAIQVDVTNIGTGPVKFVCRVENGPGVEKKWILNGSRVNPGERKLIVVPIDGSLKNQNHAIDPSGVTGLQLSIGSPKSGGTFLVHSLRAISE